MTKGNLSFGMIGAIAMASVSVGCIGTKNQEVADAPPPPPAAYPDTSGALGGASQLPTGNGSVPMVPAMSPNTATTSSGVSAVAPSPFTLREGEQLVPHQIQSGESLSSIAAKYNSSVSRIQAANEMTDTKIFAGKTLQVPTSAPPAHLGQSSAAAPAPIGGSYPGAASGPVAPTYAAAASGSYPPSMAPPILPSTPGVPASPTSPAGSTYPSTAGTGAISAPPVPQVSGSLPGYPASTSYPRSAPAPSFEGSRVQFSN